MPFILSEQRDSEEWSPGFWARYQEYLKQNESKFPKPAFKLASSEWWYSFESPKAPHDSRLISATITERLVNHRPVCSLIIVLSSAMKGEITLTYSGVKRYQLAMPKEQYPGHGDWRFDEFSISEDGWVVHTIEWADGPTWVITAKNIRHQYKPKA